MSTDKEQLLPISTIDALEALEQIKYKEGYPRQYRFDAKIGVLKIGEDEIITKKGGEFEFVPIAVRVFKGAILNYQSKKWIEFFFINQAGHLSSFMIHGFSAERFLALDSELFYDDATINDIIIKLRPEAKQSEKGSYHIASFSYQLIEPQQLDIKNTILNSLGRIYRTETAEMDVEELQSFNYSSPFASLPEAEIKTLPEAKKAA